MLLFLSMALMAASPQPTKQYEIIPAACQTRVNGGCVVSIAGGQGGNGGDASVNVYIVPRGGDGGAGGNGSSGPRSFGGSFHYVKGLDPTGFNWLALRSAPSFGAPWAPDIHMGPGTLVTVLQSSGEWYKVRLQSGAVGWANRRFIGCCRSD